MRRYRWLTICAAAVALLCLGCSRQGPDTKAAAGAPGGASPGAAALASGLGGSFVFGAEQAALRSYLENVREVKPTKFEVEWSKDVVAVSREEAMRALRSVSADGGDFVFTTADP